MINIKKFSYGASCEKWAFWIFILLGIAVRAYVIFLKTPFNSDNAVLCLMAKHILEGKDFPYFFYGALYFGSFPAYILAGIFSIVGVNILSYKIYTLIFAFGIYLSLMFTIRSFYSRKTACWTALLFIVPFYRCFTGEFINDYLTFIFIGTIVLLVITKWMDSPTIYNRLFWITGLIAGFGWYIHPLFIIFITLFFGVYVLRIICSSKKEYFIFHLEKMIIWLLCFASGSIFYWLGLVKNFHYYNPISECSSTIFELGHGLWITFGHSIPHMFGMDIVQNSILKCIFAIFYWSFLCFIGWELHRSFKAWRTGKSLMHNMVFPLLFMITAFIYLFEPSLEDTASNRHLIPLSLSIPILIALSLEKIPSKMRVLKYVIAGVIAFFNIYLIFSQPVFGQETGKLADFLEKHSLTRGFADYWVSYKLVFLSNEQIIMSPFWGVDRYESYTYDVIRSENKFYAFDLEVPDQELMSWRFEQELNRAKISYKKDVVDNFVIFHSLVILKNGIIFPVKYFTPVYEDRITKQRELHPTQYKNLSFYVSVPSATYTCELEIHSEYVPELLPDSITGTIAIKDAIRGNVIGKISVKNEDFKQNSIKTVSVTAPIVAQKWVSFDVFLEKKSMRVNYLLIY